MYTEKTDIVFPHVHGLNGSHTEIEEGRIKGDFLKFICLDDGVIYKELEIIREVK